MNIGNTGTEEYYVKNIEKCDAKRSASLRTIIVFALPLISSTIMSCLDPNFLNVIRDEIANGSGGFVANCLRDIDKTVGIGNAAKGMGLVSGLAEIISIFKLHTNTVLRNKYKQQLTNLKGEEPEKEGVHKI